MSNEPYNLFSALLIGPPGEGKTTAACTAPYPIGVIDFDNKLHKMVNIAHLIKEGKVIRIPIDTALSNIGLKRLATEKHEQGGSKVSVRPEGYLKFVNIMEKFEQSGCVWEGTKLATVVLDSYTSMCEHLKRLLMQANSKMTMTLPLYGVLLANLEEINATMLRLPCNVIMLGHQKVTKNDLTGEIMYGPLIEGQMADKIGKDFEEVYFMKKTVKQGKATFMMDTVGNNMKSCRTSRELPALIEPDFCKAYGIGR